jgi:2-polyprenyl-3-methyl-5-hydroxy-6-metoxy-1,4-benzoquinol methylase
VDRERTYVALAAADRAHAIGALVASARLQIVQPARLATLRAPYRHSLLGLVADPSAFTAAAIAQRLFRLPWAAVLLDEETVRVAATGRARRSALADAAAVIAPTAALAALAETLPHARLVALDDLERVHAVLADIQLVAAARGRSRLPAGPLVVDSWMFLNDRLTRLAVHLTKATRKSSVPVHPKHLIRTPRHWWYDDEISAGMRVLDIGCAGGEHSCHAALSGSTVTGIDVDRRALDRAAEQAARSGLTNVSFRRGDLTDRTTLRDLQPGSFDVALALDLLEHISDRQTTLKTIAGLLRPGGALLVAVPHVGTPYKRWRGRMGGTIFTDPDHKVEYTEETIRAELVGAGFEVIKLLRAGYDTPFPGFSAVVGAFSIPIFERLAARRERLLARRPQAATAWRVVARVPG